MWEAIAAAWFLLLWFYYGRANNALPIDHPAKPIYRAGAWACLAGSALFTGLTIAKEVALWIQ